MTKFIIYTPIYRNDSGGIIVLHKLASLLKSQGHVAKIWPAPYPSRQELKYARGWVKLLGWYKRRVFGQWTKQDLRSPYSLALAKQKDIKKSIVVYPEIVAGNPLGATSVVRWLLNRPGALTGKMEFGASDLFFYYHEHFNDWVINPNVDHYLNVSEVMSHIYKERTDCEREGQCFMVRKGNNRALNYHDEGAENIDNLSHEKIAEVFNRKKYFICYDLYTMYCRYAAMCGCIPIVVPEEGLSKEEWRPAIPNRYGIAYGWDDIPWAIESRDQLFKLLAEAEEQSVQSVKRFVAIVKKHFGSSART